MRKSSSSLLLSHSLFLIPYFLFIRFLFTFAFQCSFQNDQQKKYPGKSDANPLHPGRA